MLVSVKGTNNSGGVLLPFRERDLFCIYVGLRPLGLTLLYYIRPFQGQASRVSRYIATSVYGVVRFAKFAFSPFNGLTLFAA